MSKIKYWLFAATSIFLAVLVSLIFVEIIVRLFYPQAGAITWIQSHERYAYVNRSNAHESYTFPQSDFVMEIKINSIGLRERELDERFFAPNVKRVLPSLNVHSHSPRTRLNRFQRSSAPTLPSESPKRHSRALIKRSNTQRITLSPTTSKAKCSGLRGK